MMEAPVAPVAKRPAALNCAPPEKTRRLMSWVSRILKPALRAVTA
jgi:hypothetical protein